MTQSQSNNDDLDEQGKRLLAFLVSLLPRIKANDPRTFVGYKQVHDVLKLPQLGNTYGVSLQAQGLNSLADWAANSGRPGITGVIIDKVQMTPGPGYYKIFGRKPDDVNWWLAEVQKSKSYDWAPILGTTDDHKNLAAGEGWTRDELHATVIAYLEMLQQERKGLRFTKTDYYNDLSRKFGRTPKSFEYRMQNISYVLVLMGRSWLTGLKPARNVGANIATQIEELIAEAEGTAVTPTVEFEMAVNELAKKEQSPPPPGSVNPKATSASVTQFQRDPSVKAWILVQANGICECCEQRAPFMGANGLPYLEVHHVRRLAELGSDTINNAVAVCPNCHKELHYGEKSKELVEKLYISISRLQRE